jgi:hypothetical protein
MKRLLATFALVTAVLCASASTAAANEITVSHILCADSTYKAQWVPAGSAGDTNKNGAVCVKAKKVVDELRVFTITVTLNSAGCATGSSAISASLNPSADANLNGIVCYSTTGKWSDDLATLGGLSIQ